MNPLEPQKADGGRVAIITRMTTQNAGNEALSRELIRFVQNSPGVGEIRVLDRHPTWFDTLTLDQLGEDVETAFDQLADQLIRTRSPVSAPPLAPLAMEANIRLNERGRELPGVVKTFKQKIALRRNLAKLGVIGREDVARTLNTCAWADLVIWNPAGEFHPTGDRDQTFRLMLLLRIAQMKGAKTAIVNHSIEIVDPQLRRLVAHVYKKADVVGVRDPASFQEALALGVDPARLFESPDLVFLAPGGAYRKPPPSAPIGLAINGREALAGIDEWDALIGKLRGMDRELVFVSNAVHHDKGFANSLVKRFGGRVIERQPNYHELADILAGVAVLISSRLHSFVLAMASGVPVVTIEPQLFKLTAIIQQLEYPIETESLKKEGWADRVAAKTAFALENGPAIGSFTETIRQQQLDRIHSAYRPMFALAKIGAAERFRASQRSLVDV